MWTKSKMIRKKETQKYDDHFLVKYISPLVVLLLYFNIFLIYVDIENDKNEFQDIMKDLNCVDHYNITNISLEDFNKISCICHKNPSIHGAPTNSKMYRSMNKNSKKH